MILKGDAHKPWVYFLGCGDNSLDFKLYAWVGGLYTRFRVRADLCEAIDHAFRVNDIDTPFPQRTIWLGKAAADRLSVAPDMTQPRQEATRIGPEEADDG